MPTLPDHLAIVVSRAGSKSHVLDRRYAPIGKALCGAAVRVAERPPIELSGVTCKRCREEGRRLAAPAP